MIEPEPAPSEQREAICILGGRSGTSLVARLVNLLGVYLGPEEHMIAPGSANEAGFWEHAGIVALNDEILARYGCKWPKVAPLPRGWEADPALNDLRDRARKLLRDEFAGASIWGWKDPRTCVTLPFWQELAPRVRYVLCFRNPVDTATSNARTFKALAPEAVWAHLREHLYRTGLVNWLEFVRNMLQQTSGKPRMTLLYEDVMEHTESEVRRIAAFLGRPEAGSNPAVLAAIREFKSDKLRHHNTPTEKVLAEPALPMIAKKAFISLRAQVTIERAWPGSGAVDAQPPGGHPLADLHEADEDRRAQQSLVQRTIQRCTPTGAHVIAVSHGDDELVGALGRTASHFPQDQQGRYTGYHPADSAEAISALETEESRTASAFLVFPRRQMWWLDHYTGFRDYLDSRHSCVYDGAECVLYRLRPPVEAGVVAPARQGRVCGV